MFPAWSVGALRRTGLDRVAKFVREADFIRRSVSEGGLNCFGNANLIRIRDDRNQKNACLMMLKHALVRCNPLQSRVLDEKAYDAQTKKLHEKLFGNNLSVFHIVHAQFRHVHAAATFCSDIHVHGTCKGISRNQWV